MKAANLYYEAIGYAPGEPRMISARYFFSDGKTKTRVFEWEGDKFHECRPEEDADGDRTWVPVTLASWGEIEQLGQDGWNVFSHPNHVVGGLGNKHAQSFTTLFYEIDDANIEEQWEKVNYLKTLGLTPAAVVFSGGKSLHVYVRLNRSIDADRWLRLNRLLTIAVHGDPAINTLARAMRLPGVVRAKNGQQNEVSILESSEAQYSPDFVESTLAFKVPHGLSDERWRLWRKHRIGGELEKAELALATPETELFPRREYKPREVVQYSGDCPPIPLENCLSKANRELLEYGGTEGDRDNGGLRLAKDLIGCADWLSREGIRFDGDPRQLFDDYVSRSGLSHRDGDRIWRSASRGNPTPARKDLTDTIGWWQWKNGDRPVLADRQITQVQWQKLKDERGKGFAPVATPELTPQERKELRHQCAKEAYKNLTRLTYPVSVELNQQFLDGGANLIEWGKPNFVSSACKTGKTTLLGEVVERHRNEFPEAKTYAIGYRNALLRQTCQRAGLTHIEDLTTQEEGSGKGFKTDPRVINGTREIALCLDSLLKIELDKIQPNSLVILDEVDAIVNHAIEGGTLGDDQEQILTYWKAFLNRVLELGGTILGMEDDLTDTPIDFLREFTGNRFETRLIRNSFQASKWDVEIGSGSPHGLLRKAVESVKAGKKIAIAFTGQERGELCHAVIDRMTNGKLKIVRIDRETTQAGTDTTVAMHELMTAPDEWVDAHQPDILQFSPVIESGVSFWTEHFDEYYLFASHLETRKHIQILERIRRDDVKRYIHVRDYNQSHGGTDPDRILKDLQRTARQTARVVGLNPEKLDALESQNQESDLFNRYAAKFQARHNAAAVRMAGNLIDALKERGHNVTETKWEKDDQIKELYDAAKIAKEEKSADDWDAAPGDSSVSAAKETLKSPGSTREDRIDAQKSILKADYPGLDLSRDFLLEMVIRNRRAGLKETELEWITENPEIAVLLDRKAMESAIDKPLLLYRRLTHRRLKGDLIRSLDGFIEALQSGKELRPSDSEVKSWHRILCDRRQEVYRILGLTAHIDIKPIRLLSYVADRLGYDLKSIKREGSRGNRQRVYIAVERNPEYRQQIKEALSRRYASLIKEEEEAITRTLDVVRDSDPVSTKRNTTKSINHFVDTNLMESVKALQGADSRGSGESSRGWTGLVGRISEAVSRAWGGAWSARGQSVTVVGEPVYNDFFRRWQIDCQLAIGQVVAIPHEAFELARGAIS